VIAFFPVIIEEKCEKKCNKLNHFDCCFSECVYEQDGFFVDGKVDTKKMFNTTTEMFQHPFFNETDKWLSMNQKSFEVCEKLSEF
jgi:hypothetical protein